MWADVHPAAGHTHLPAFIPDPGGTDVLMAVMAVFLVVAVLIVGNLFLRLHTLPERMAHRTHKLQFEIVAVLGLIALFTHMHIFWVIGLLLAMIDLPDFGTPLRSMAGSLEKMAGGRAWRRRGQGARHGGRAPRRRWKEPERGDRRAPRPRRRRGVRGAWARRPAAAPAGSRADQGQGDDQMLELLLCSLLTILPDYLFRRYVQGRRLGKEITFYSVWFELRWGITACLMLTVGLITVIFYNHPSTTNVTAFYRTVPIVPEANGRVAETYVGFTDDIKQGQPIFRLDSSKQEAAVEAARKKIAEIDAEMIVAKSDIAAADGKIQEARVAHQQAVDELETKQELQRRNPGMVPARDIEKLQLAVEGRQGTILSATASKEAAQGRVSTLLPAGKESAEAALNQAQVDLDKTVIRAGVTGRVEQFALRVGDIVNPFMRPAGVLIPEGAGRQRLQAGFGQIEAQIMKVGMIAEATCVSKPWTVIPMVVTGVQDFIAAGQFRGGEQLVDPQQVTRPGTILVFLEPLYAGGLDGVTPGSSCIANAYSSNHDLLQSKDIGSVKRFVLHAVDAVGLVHAMILRIQALVLPIKTLVFSGH